MKFSLLIKWGVILASFFCLIAPFTYLKPPVFEKTENVVSEKEMKDKRSAVNKKVSAPQEQPLHALNLPNFSNIVDVKEKKRQFFAFIRPAVELENNKVLQLRQAIQLIVNKLSLAEPLTSEEERLLQYTSKNYKVSAKYSQLHQAHQLLDKVDVVPTNLVLVQAANESAWGTSRFARIGLNYFGIWCYRQGCGLVPSGRNVGAKHEVAAFNSVEHAVERYLFNINTNNAYRTFRNIRAQLRANDEELVPEVLVTGLLPYSERGIDYVMELTEMIRHNQAYFVASD